MFLTSWVSSGRKAVGRVAESAQVLGDVSQSAWSSAGLPGGERRLDQADVADVGGVEAGEFVDLAEPVVHRVRVDMERGRGRAPAAEPEKGFQGLHELFAGIEWAEHGGEPVQCLAGAGQL